jgi:hypothetical protein
MTEEKLREIYKSCLAEKQDILHASFFELSEKSKDEPPHEMLTKMISGCMIKIHEEVSISFAHKLLELTCDNPSNI